MSEAHRDLPAGSIVRHRPSDIRYKLEEDMRGDWAHVHRIRKDEARDKRQPVGWSGRLPADEYEVERRGRAWPGATP